MYMSALALGFPEFNEQDCTHSHQGKQACKKRNWIGAFSQNLFLKVDKSSLVTLDKFHGKEKSHFFVTETV